MKYLIIKCHELKDPWECDVARRPVCITNDFNKFNKFGYEIYEIRDNGTFRLLKDYEKGSRR